MGLMSHLFHLPVHYYLLKSRTFSIDIVVMITIILIILNFMMIMIIFFRCTPEIRHDLLIIDGCRCYLRPRLVLPTIRHRCGRFLSGTHVQLFPGVQFPNVPFFFVLLKFLCVDSVCPHRCFVRFEPESIYPFFQYFLGQCS